MKPILLPLDDEGEVAELRRALSARATILEGMAARAKRSERPAISLKRQKVLDLIAKLNSFTIET
jgi:hypothetical protein